MAAKRYPVFVGIRVSETMAEKLRKEMEDTNLPLAEITRRALAIYLGDK